MDKQMIGAQCFINTNSSFIYILKFFLFYIFFSILTSYSIVITNLLKVHTISLNLYLFFL